MKKKQLIVGLISVVILALLTSRVIRIYRSHVLLDWKRTAIPALEAFCDDTNSIAQEIELITAVGNIRTHSEWYSTRLLHFRNDEWAAYVNRSIRQNWRFPDIVITKGSDGRWFYTTLHFCPDMIELIGTPQPASLSAFRERYLFREFSGNPEEQLPPTWEKGMAWPMKVFETNQPSNNER